LKNTDKTRDELKQDYSKKYRNDNYDRIEIMVPKGYRQTIKDHAARFQAQVGEPSKAGYSPQGSVTAFITRAIQETIERDIALNFIKDHLAHVRVMEEAVKHGIIKISNNQE
jgi:hypothetical protein